MTLLVIRIFFLIVSTIIGYYIGDLAGSPWFGVQAGFAASLALILIEKRLETVSVRGLSSMVFGLVLGIIMAKLLADIFTLLPMTEFFHSSSRVVLTIVFSYLGAVMALRGKDEFNIIIPYVRFKRQDAREDVILLDTSAIIDGRIADIYKANFLSGRLVAPRFVLRELQSIADSADKIKRQRGRRGLELLHMMQDDPKIDLYIHEDDLTGAEGVDAKLVTLARLMEARICTTDYNLSQMATLRNVEVLNVHSLSNSVKSVVFSGEEINISLIKEGREAGQAVGYLEDGTMVIVSDAKSKIGENVRANVTSVLQTQAGKIVFAKLSY